MMPLYVFCEARLQPCIPESLFGLLLRDDLLGRRCSQLWLDVEQILETREQHRDVVCSPTKEICYFAFMKNKLSAGP
jgi:hypothetical protein